MSKRYTAQEMRNMAIEAETMEVADQFYGHDMDTIAAMLRQAADMMERKKKFEYAVEFCDYRGKWVVYTDGLTLVQAQKLAAEKWRAPHRIVRREAVEWEQEEEVSE